MKHHPRFANRAEAGRALAARLQPYRRTAPVVVALPRGGVPVAYEVARSLGAPLDVCEVRKISAPLRPELTIGALAEGEAIYVDHELADDVGVDVSELAARVATTRAELAALVVRQVPLDVRERTVILVDDGVATGATVRAAIRALRGRGARRLVVAVPVGPARTLGDLGAFAEDVIALRSPDQICAVGHWYDDFTPASDEEITSLLARARAEQAPPMQSSIQRAFVSTERDVRIPIDEDRDAFSFLEGRLVVPPFPRALVLFAHGSGGGLAGSRNAVTAEALRRAGFATLRMDLLTADEIAVDRRTAALRFDIERLATRLAKATDWARAQPDLERLSIGYFAASTGAAAALVAASAAPESIGAIVLRGGRPDLARCVLSRVRAPTLLLVGSEDRDVLTLNREAEKVLACEHRLEVVDGASHLFEEAGAIERVGRSAATWFSGHLHATTLEALA